MRLLDRYLLRELLAPLGYCLGGFLIFWMSFDMFTQMGEFQENGVPFVVVLQYYGYKTPEFLVLILPITLLLAMLYTLTNHSRHNELVSIRAAGVGVMRLGLPYLGVGLSMSLGLLAVNELWVPRAGEAAERLLSRSTTEGALETDGRWQAVNFVNVPARRFWTIGGFNLDTHEMRDLHVVWTQAGGAECTVHAAKARRLDGQWRLENAQKIVRSSAGPPGVPETHAELIIPELAETPEQIRSEIKISRLTGARARAAKEAQVSIAEILNYLTLNPNPPGERRSLLFTQLHGRVAGPWTALVVVLIAMPFGISSHRRNALAGVAGSIFICFTYFVILRLGLALGTGGYVPAWLGAWLPNLLFAATGAILTFRLR
jgi:LPS export ABC transporter permease LptG